MCAAQQTLAQDIVEREREIAENVAVVICTPRHMWISLLAWQIAVIGRNISQLEVQALHMPGGDL